MRKLILSVLLASVAVVPATAQRADRQEAREQRREAREERRQERSSSSDETRREPSAREERRADRGDVQAVREPRQAAQRSGDGIRDARFEQRQQLRESRRDGRQLRQSERAAPPVLRNRVPVVSATPRPGTQPPLRTEGRRPSSQHWSTNWRRSGRYDWYNWRNRNRSLFRLGFYSDPFGWGYRPYSIGWRLWPSYYNRSYWLNDPWQYRLPYAPPGYRWIRYYNDAILVDTWNGQVADVIHNFFW